MSTPAELAALRDRIADILLTDPCQRIRFNVAGFSIRPGGYTVIGLSIAVRRPTRPVAAQRRRMAVRVAPLGVHVGAEYRAARNEIVVPSAAYGGTVPEQMALVHEATHAVFDFYRSRIGAWNEEAAAYIAGAIFRRLSGHALVGSGIFGVAEDIAQSLVAPQPLAPWTQDVSQADLDRLVSVIRASTTYRGLRRQRRGYRYRHDGGSL